MPNSVHFETVYVPGKVEAVSYRDGKEISRDVLVTAGDVAEIRLIPEKSEMRADGHDLIYVGIELLDKDGRLVPDASVPLMVEVEGCAALAGFGSANPVTDEDYTEASTVSYRGRALAIIRSGYESGSVNVKVCAEGMEPVSRELWTK
jgi:beta-galactosidase